MADPNPNTAIPPDAKRCSRCRRVLPRTHFNRTRQERDGRHCQCKDCYGEYYRAHRAEIKTRDHARYVRNREACLAQQKRMRKPPSEWTAEQLQRKRDRDRRRRQREDVKTSERIRQRDRYARNPDNGRAWNHIARARRKAAFVEYVDPAVVYERDGGKCGLCWKHVAKAAASVDHILPLSKGGKHEYGNVQLAHYKCNCSKGARIKGQFRLV